MAVLISGWGVEAKKSSAGLHFVQFLPNSVYFSHSLEDSRPPTSKAPRPVRELQIRMPCEAFSAAWRHGATLTHSAIVRTTVFRAMCSGLQPESALLH